MNEWESEQSNTIARNLVWTILRNIWVRRSTVSVGNHTARPWDMHVGMEG